MAERFASRLNVWSKSMKLISIRTLAGCCVIVAGIFLPGGAQSQGSRRVIPDARGTFPERMHVNPAGLPGKGKTKPE
jgi:hypothetical protein